MKSNEMTSDKTASNDNLESLCQHCGKTLSDFLHEMEHHNAEVVCPSCGKPQDGTGRPQIQSEAQKQKKGGAPPGSGDSPSSGKTQTGDGRKVRSRAPAAR